MKLGVLFSGGKDSTLATCIAKREGYEISCLITIVSENKESFMFHTPSIKRTEEQSRSMGVPIIIKETKGDRESELIDLEAAIVIAKEKYQIEGIVSGAVESVYQASRIQRICNNLGLECFNPLWQMNQIELLGELVKNKFEVIVVGVFAYPLDGKFLGRKIDNKFIDEITELKERWGISPSGEGGEFESFVLNCPLFEEKLKIKSFKDIGEGSSWRREIVL